MLIPLVLNIKFQIYKSKKKQYKIFTKQFDLSVKAEKLSNKDELINLRKKFEKEYSENSKLINKLVRKLDKLFQFLDECSSWRYNQEVGYFDSSKLASFIANPDYLNIFKYEENTKEKKYNRKPFTG